MLIWLSLHLTLASALMWCAGVARRRGKGHPDAIRHAKLAFREIRVLRFLKESWKDSCVASGVPEDEIFGNQQFNLVGMRDCFLTEPVVQRGTGE